MSTIALYCRVSTEEQAQHGFSIENQKERLIAYCKSQGWDDYQLYIDDGYTGTNMDRPGLQRLLEDAKSGQIGVVVVYKLDRLSRKQKDVLHLLEDEFEKYNVAFKSSTEPFDTSTPLGKAMLGILAVFAQLERDTIVERLSTGLRQRVKSGKWSGGRVPFGYRYNQNTGKLTVHPQQADFVRELFSRYLRGHSLTELAEWMSAHTDERVFDHGVIRDMLQRRIYIGESAFGGTTSTEVAETIVEPAIFQAVQREIDKRKQRKTPSGEYLLTGLLRCGTCGGPFIHVIRRSARGNSRSYQLYACKQQHHRPRGSNGQPCNVGYRNQESLEQWVINQLYEVALYQAEIRALQEQRNHARHANNKPKAKSAAALKAELRKIDQKLNRWYDAFEEGQLDPHRIQARINSLDASRRSILERMAALKEPEPAPHISIPDPRTLIRESWRFMTLEEQRDVLRAAIEEIIVTPKGQDPVIVWNT